MRYFTLIEYIINNNLLILVGKANEDSDIDFLVDMEPGPSLFDLRGLLMDLQKLLRCNVDVVTKKGFRERLHYSVLKEAIPL